MFIYYYRFQLEAPAIDRFLSKLPLKVRMHTHLVLIDFHCPLELRSDGFRQSLIEFPPTCPPKVRVRVTRTSVNDWYCSTCPLEVRVRVSGDGEDLTSFFHFEPREDIGPCFKTACIRLKQAGKNGSAGARSPLLSDAKFHTAVAGQYVEYSGENLKNQHVML